MKLKITLIYFILFLNSFFAIPSGKPEGFGFNNQAENSTPWFINSLQSRLITTVPSKYPVIIAVIDDAFNLNSSKLKPFLFHNEKDAINSFDDDANSYKDDFTGWDISDNDGDVNPPLEKIKEYNHGTFISGLIIDVLQSCYGDKASEYFKILPIKAISDFEKFTYIKDGYKAMNYAQALNANILCCAWGSNLLKTEEKEILKSIHESGIMVVAAAGNFSNTLDYYPASADNVLAIAATDSLNRKLKISNFGKFVDLTAPGANIIGLSSVSEKELSVHNGTSPATAIATAAAAILKLNFPEKSVFEIEEILKETANPIDSINQTYIGRLGAGALNFKNIIDVIDQKKDIGLFFNSSKQKGFINISNSKKAKKEWDISPYGNNLGIEFKILDLKNEPKDGILKFETRNQKTIEIKLNEWQKHKRFVIDNNGVKMNFVPNKASKKLNVKLSYEVMPIDSSILFCSGKQYFKALTDTITDGSGISDYANNCDCKWQITVPEGYRISFEFKDFDTEAIADNLFLFDGEYAIPENAIARFSGPDIPPTVVSRTNNVLVWFVTDNKKGAKGWEFIYRAVKIQ